MAILTALKATILYIAAVLIMAAALFVPAGTLDYWQAWLFLATLLIPVTIFIAYLALFDPALMKRRMRYTEKQPGQIKLSPGPGSSSVC